MSSTTFDVLHANATPAKICKYSCLGYAGVSTTKGKISKSDIQDPYYNRHVSLRWNYRMSEVCSAVTLGQLEHLEELVDMRKESARIFVEAVADTKIMAPQKVNEGYENAY